ncbi:MAG: epoxyqueuosine reductase QueH [Candidatus Aminicenantes bacterium]|nr:MAG: epoxyqueuosine reductase QueH [Candidatus Aminicenantes bacterium]
MKKRLLLHVCCAPCAVYVYQKLSEDYDVTCFFYNPNIQPAREYQSRKKELERIASMNQWDVLYGDYDLNRWFQQVKGHEKDPERGERCSICFHMRLEKAFEYARTKGFDTVASTLSISPYKVTRQINAQGEKLSRTFDIEFLPENFKKQNGYHIGKKMAVEMGIKHQVYCGCLYSKAEKKRKQTQK